jgi:hypothetical protein
VETWQLVTTVTVAGVAAIIAATLTGVKGLITKLLQYLEAKIGTDSILEALNWVSTLRRVSLDFHHLQYVDRVILFIAVDYHYPSDLKRRCKVRAFDGWSTDGNGDPIELYGHLIEVDEHYLSILNDIMTKRQVEITSESLPENSLLKGYYLADGVKESIIYLLKDCGKGRILYMSVASLTVPFTVVQKARISLLVDQVRSALYDAG